MRYLILLLALSSAPAHAGLLDLFGLLSWNDREINDYIKTAPVVVGGVTFEKGMIEKGGVRVIDKKELDKIVSKDVGKRKADAILKDFNLVVK